MSSSVVQLLDIETAEVVREYSGQKQGNYIIRSTFGGAAENFVVSGSEGKSISPFFRTPDSYVFPRLENLRLAQRKQHARRYSRGPFQWLRQCRGVESQESRNVRVCGR